MLLITCATGFVSINSKSGKNMNVLTPTQQELNTYFFNDCDDMTSTKVEKWFFFNGKTEEATNMLFSLWEEVNEKPQTGEEKTEVLLAFERFKNHLINMNELPDKPTQKGVRKLSGIKRFIPLFQRMAATLLLPVCFLAAYQYYSYWQSQDIVWMEKDVKNGTVAQVQLPDGSSVWLNAGSKLIYPQEFKSNYRQIFFTGEGYFNVVKDKSKPFNIQTNGASVKVLGTEFNLRSYSGDRSIELALVRGKVAFQGDRQEHDLVMNAGEELAYDRHTRQITMKHSLSHDVSSWKEGKYYFKNKSLEEIISQLERNFNVRFVIKNESLKQIRYYMAFVNNESIDEILSHLGRDERIHIKRRGDLIEID